MVLNVYVFFYYFFVNNIEKIKLCDLFIFIEKEIRSNKLCLVVLCVVLKFYCRCVVVKFFGIIYLIYF